MASHSTSLPLCGLVLAGGSATRLGGLKSRRLLEGQSWVERAVGKVERYCTEIYVSVRTQSEPIPATAQRLLDIDPSRESQGPLAGIHALAQRPRCDALVLACDYPLVQPELFAELIERTEPDGICLVLDEGGQRHPLLAFWSAAALAHGARCYEAGERALHRVCQELPVREYAVAGSSTLNVNRPAELRQLEQLLARDLGS